MKSKIHHPDSRPETDDDAEFLLIRDAYETLRKKDSRVEYDSFLKAKQNTSIHSHHPAGHPIYSKDFVKWRARHHSFNAPKGWKYSHEEEKESIDLMSMLYFAIFCGIISYIVVSEKVRRGKVVSYSSNNFPMYEYRQQILANRTQGTRTADEKSVIKTETPASPTTGPETHLNELKTWK